jgi:hypothetical protein
MRKNRALEILPMNWREVEIGVGAGGYLCGCALGIKIAEAKQKLAEQISES